MKWTSWIALVALVVIGGFVVYSSLTLGSVRCEVCIAFRGREACRAVEGATAEEATEAARTNACAFLASGVTDSMACQRAPGARTSCEAAR